jgi:hypothetical protein
MNTFTREDYALISDTIADVMMDLEHLIDHEPDDYSSHQWQAQLIRLEALAARVSAARGTA